MDAKPMEQRRPRGKRGRRDLVVNHLQVIALLKQRDLQAVLLGAAVWLCVDDDTVHKLDALCFGNLDGGDATAEHVAALLAAAGAPPASGSKSVRLSLDEAYFMAYALEAIAVWAPGAGACGAVRRLDSTELWRALCAARPDFLLLYLAYHHFKSKGWVVRTGLQYGSDMVLYRRHPALCHSEYSVLLVPRGQGLRPELGWHDIQVTNRLSAQVSKKLLLLYVQEEGGPSDHSTPRCLAHFSVQERLVRRWVPESQRMPK